MRWFRRRDAGPETRLLRDVPNVFAAPSDLAGPLGDVSFIRRVAEGAEACKTAHDLKTRLKTIADTARNALKEMG